MLFEQELSDKVLGCAFEVYNTLGNGFLEKVYEEALLIELESKNIKAESQKEIKVYYKNNLVGEYLADIIVEEKIILELKSCSTINDAHVAQLLNYLTATGIKIGYLLNFGKAGILQYKRIVK